MEMMILRWEGCGHEIEFPRPMCGGEHCLCATCHPDPVHVSPGKCHRCAVKRSRIAEGQPCCGKRFPHLNSGIGSLLSEASGGGSEQCRQRSNRLVRVGSLESPGSDPTSEGKPLRAKGK